MKTHTPTHSFFLSLSLFLWNDGYLSHEASLFFHYPIRSLLPFHKKAKSLSSVHLESFLLLTLSLSLSKSARVHAHAHTHTGTAVSTYSLVFGKVKEKKN